MTVPSAAGEGLTGSHLNPSICQIYYESNKTKPQQNLPTHVIHGTPFLASRGAGIPYPENVSMPPEDDFSGAGCSVPANIRFY